MDRDNTRPLSSTDQAIRALQDGAEKIASQLPWPDRRLSIVLTGIAPGCDFAYFVCISNYDDLNCIRSEAEDHFVFNQRTIPLHGDRTMYVPVGALLNEKELTMSDELSRIAQFGGINNAARYMVEIQRSVAARTPTVGHDAMVVAIPARPTTSFRILTDTEGDQVNANTASYSFVKAGGFSRVRFAPIWACGGWAHTSSAEGDGDNGVIRMTVLRTPTPPPATGSAVGGL